MATNKFTFGGFALANNVRQLVYTCPSGTGDTAIIHSCTVANTHATDTANITLEVYDNTAAVYFDVAKNVPVPAGSTLVLDGVKVNLLEDDRFHATSSDAAGKLTVLASVLEIIA
tara:strand:+ start:770 stop:1114 length:345 start_codon:yes stop_codon:yes gene_type:complete